MTNLSLITLGSPFIFIRSLWKSALSSGSMMGMTHKERFPSSNGGGYIEARSPRTSMVAASGVSIVEWRWLH